MHVIRVRNADEALLEALHLLYHTGINEASRNGPVRVAPEPVCTVYTHPLERVLLHPQRDANPFFHFMEALWMLAGRNDVATVKEFNSRIDKYSDDGEVLHGAYGFRWREWFSFDQLAELIHLLQNEPDTRRAVLAMWSPSGDLVASEGVGGITMKDVPCNTHAYFDRRGGQLNMTVMCRSNDAVWGAYGANVVHFSFLLEYVAASVGVPVGMYRQFSNNLHVYQNLPGLAELLPLNPCNESAAYANGAVKPFPLLNAGESMAEWNADLDDFFAPDNDVPMMLTCFFREVAVPLRAAWRIRKRGLDTGRAEALEIAATDWRMACVNWIDRRTKQS